MVWSFEGLPTPGTETRSMQVTLLLQIYLSKALNIKSKHRQQNMSAVTSSMTARKPHDEKIEMAVTY